MVDYTKATGEGGKLVIRDNGTTVEFLLQAGYSSTFSSVTWSGTVNGSSVGGTVNYPTGAPLMSLGSWTVSTTQDVTFAINATGTSGLGGPTSFTQNINRTPPANPPGAPDNLRVTVKTPTRIAIAYDRGPNNGAAITQDVADWYEIPPGGNGILVWRDTNAAGLTDPQDGAVGPKLKPGTSYNVYITSKNSAGDGPPAMISVVTSGGGSLKINGAYRLVTPYVKINGVYRSVTAFVKINGTYRSVT